MKDGNYRYVSFILGFYVSVNFGVTLMGSCYSCRSNGGPTTYTTVAMANVDDPKDKRKTPYARDRSGYLSFKRKNPATMKSHSQERTSELINIYETKIANVGNSSSSAKNVVAGHLVMGPNKLSSSASTVASSMSSKSSNTGMLYSANKTASNSSATVNTVSSGNKRGSVNSDQLGTERSNHSDDNCNIMVTNSLAAAKSLPPNKVNSMLGSPKHLAAKHRPGRENSPDLILTTKAGVEDMHNGNDKRSNKAERSDVTSTKIPLICKTKLSGLPRPQVPILVSKPGAMPIKASVNDDKDFEPDSQSLTSVEPMQISAENIPNDDNLIFEGDSGIGTSVSDRKADGDTETLAEVEQIEGDSVSLASFTKERFPEKLDVTVVNIEKPVKKEIKTQQNSQDAQTKISKSGIARLKSVLPSKIGHVKPSQDSRSSQVLSDKVGKAAASKSLTQHSKSLLRKKQPLSGEFSKSSSEKSTPKSSPKRIARSIKEIRNEDKALRNSKKNCDSSDEWKILTESRQKENITPDIEEVDIQPLTITTNKQGPSAQTPNELKIGHKSPRIETVLPPSVFERKDNKSKEEISKTPKNSPMTLSSNENSLADFGPYSPPSEKDFFLIDDEIADQPALIACQTLGPSTFHSSHRDSRYATASHLMTKFQSVNVTDLNEEGKYWIFI